MMISAISAIVAEIAEAQKQTEEELSLRSSLKLLTGPVVLKLDDRTKLR